MSRLDIVTSRWMCLFQIPLGVTSASVMVMVHLDAPMAIFAIAVEATNTKVSIVRRLHTVLTAKVPIWLPLRNAQYGSGKQKFAKSKLLKTFPFQRLEN
jgi:hypothetical protein